MKKKYLFLLCVAAAALTLLLSGCGKSGQDLEGKYIATFELNGGILDINSSAVSTKIHYAYDPGDHLLDPSTYGNYELRRSGYDFTGWYKTADCREEDKWDFRTDTINQEKITLYAGWVRKIVYSYSVCYVDEGESLVKLGSYSVSQGDVFDDYRHLADNRENYTAIGYYADQACTEPWNFKKKHPGGESDTDVCVYVKYIEGDWILVDSYAKLKSAITKGNVYLTADIDCGGEELASAALLRQYSRVFEGNGFTVSNFRVESQGTALTQKISIFQTLTNGAKLQNVSFENVTFQFTGVSGARDLAVAALAQSGTGYHIENVTVTGKLVTDYTGEFPRLNEALYQESSEGQIINFTANITVEKQPQENAAE